MRFDKVCHCGNHHDAFEAATKIMRPLVEEMAKKDDGKMCPVMMYHITSYAVQLSLQFIMSLATSEVEAREMNIIAQVGMARSIQNNESQLEAAFAELITILAPAGKPWDPKAKGG